MMSWMTGAAIAAAALVAPQTAMAQQVVETYVARLGSDDHFNSAGERLTEAAAIIRQDRANFHVYGIRDRGDQSDTFFKSKSNRARMERMLRAGGGSRSAIKAIVDGNALVEVVVYRDSIEVTVLE